MALIGHGNIFFDHYKNYMALIGYGIFLVNY